MTNWNYDTVKVFIEDNGCKLLSDTYTKMNNKIMIECKCGNEFSTTFNRFVFRNKRQCNTCSNVVSWNIDSVAAFIENNSECKLVSTVFENIDAKIIIKCKCGNNFETTFYKFQKRDKRQCNECSGVKTYTLDEAKYIIEHTYSNLVGVRYTVISDEFKNYNTPITFIDENNYKYKTSLANINICIKIKSTTNIFSAYNPYTIDNINNYLMINNIPYTLLSNSYKKNHEHLKWKCDKGHTFIMQWANFQSRKRCPFCNISKGETRINDFLSLHKIGFDHPKEYDGLIGLHGGNLSYDFYIPRYNLLIEYQGEQHERPVDFAGKGQKWAKAQLKKQQEHDRRKRNYAQNNNIKLLEIWYYDYDNIEQILTQELQLT
jgi:hypothetical protein